MEQQRSLQTPGHSGVRTSEQPNQLATNADPRSRRSLVLARYAVLALFLLTVALITALVAAAIRSDYVFAYRQAETLTSTLSTAVEEHVTRTTLETDRVLRGLVQQIESRGGPAASDPGALHVALKQQAEEAPQLESLFVLDANGDVVASGLSPRMTPVNLADRDYFRHFLDGNNVDLYVGKRIQSRVTGNILFTLTRRISGRDGSFRGVLAAGVRTDYFRQFYDRLKLPTNSSILIARRDGFLLFRHPERQYMTGTDDISRLSVFKRHLPQASTGTFEVRSPFDRLDRVVSYRSVEGLPVVVMLTIPVDVALAGWKVDAVRKSAFAALMLLLLGALAWLVRRQLLRAERAEAALNISQARFQDLATLASDGFWAQDREHRLTWIGERMSSLLGPLAVEFSGKPLWELPIVNLDDADWTHHRTVLDQRLPFRDLVLKFNRHGKALWMSISGNPLFDSAGAFSGYHGIARDLSEEMESRSEIAQHALLDPLTRLPNRRLLRDRLDQAIAKARRSGTGFALAFLDLDKFKAINDSMGHHVGDELLKAAARRMTEVVRESDTLARLGGDEFVAVLNEVAGGSTATEIAVKMLESLSQPFEIEGSKLAISASVGLAVYPEHGSDPGALLRAADEAMYRVKAAGRAGVAVAGEG